MPISDAKILSVLEVICEQYDGDLPEGTIYKIFARDYDVEGIVNLYFNEINYWTPSNTPVLKHQRVEGLKTFGHRPVTLRVLEDISDFISSSKINEWNSYEKTLKHNQ